MRAAGALLLAALSGCAIRTGVPETPLPDPVHTGFDVRRDVVYTPAGWPQELRADLYVPDGTGPFPGVVTVHGGGWNARTRGDMDGIAAKLARRGYVVANVSYRLAPAHLYPAARDDVRLAVRWLRAHATELKLDARRIGGWGYSAGAHLVALVAMADGDPAARLQAIVVGGTPASLPHYPHSPIITRFIGGTFAQRREAWLEASPVTHASRDDPPAFVYHGTWDRLVYLDDAVALERALARAGVPVETYYVRGGAHITTFLLGFGAERAALQFLDRHLRIAAR